MYKCFFKRLIDFIFVFCVLAVIWPILLIITIWLHFVNKGAGAFFMQERPGKGGKLFKVIKFKSMTDERDERGNLLPNEQRITKVGTFIRRTSIDELPQLFNVLKGDMALIGPRPLLPEYLPYYTKRESLRHSVRVGITGLAQVSGRNNLSWNERLEMDAYYAEHVSFLLDMKILLQTIKNVLSHKDVVVVLDEKKNQPLHIYRGDQRK
ncbi:sugar transferase [Parabacteroides merdae]|uniref:sugar transferase n=1 Tax=Parabacteroides merdae TaxID=46503 RepID=UPI0032C06461